MEKPIKTVQDLIEKLQQFDPNMELDIDATWYDDEGNYNHAHRDIWRDNNGIELCVTEDEPGIVNIFNVNAEEVRLYKE